MIKPYIPYNVEVVQGDFIEYVNNAWRFNIEFDTIIVDIFTGKYDVDKDILEDVQIVCDDYVSTFPDTKVLYWRYQKSREREIVDRFYQIKGMRERQYIW